MKSIAFNSEAITNALACSVKNSIHGNVPWSFKQLTSLKHLFLEGTSLKGDFQGIFCDDHTYESFYADCLGTIPEVFCPCCTHCCLSDGAGCVERDT